MRETDTKERLILAAIDLFSTKGYEGTTVEEIAKAVGIKAPSIYAHFKGKEVIWQAVSDYADAEYKKGMRLGREASKHVCTGEDLKEFTKKSVLFTLNNEVVCKMRRMVTIEQYRNKMFSEHATLYQITIHKDTFAEIFRRMMDAGLMKVGNPDICAFEYIAPITLLIQLCDREFDRQNEALSILEEHIDMFIERYFT